MTVRLANITIDCGDALALARFWSAALGRPLAEEPAPSEYVASIGGAATHESSDEGPNWLFAKVSEGKTAKNRMHVDLVTEDAPAEIDRLVDLGATRVADKDEWGMQWTVMTDPEGNEFCVARS